MKDNTTLEERMIRAQQGDQAAYTSLLQEIAHIARAVLYPKMAREGDVEDVVQEVLISVHKARHTYDGKRPLRPWIMAIITYRFNDYLRKYYRMHQHEAKDFDSMAEKLSVTKTDEQSELLDVLATLPERQQHIVSMMKIEGYTAKEVAEKMNMTESAVKVAAHRSYKQLKEALEQNAS